MIGKKDMEEIWQCWPSCPQPDSAKGKFSYDIAPVPRPGIVLCNSTMGAVEQCKKELTGIKREFSSCLLQNGCM